jgi:hypothetical protein
VDVTGSPVEGAVNENKEGNCFVVVHFEISSSDYNVIFLCGLSS